MYYYSKQARVFGYLLFFLEQKHRHRHGPTVDGLHRNQETCTQ